MRFIHPIEENIKKISQPIIPSLLDSLMSPDTQILENIWECSEARPLQIRFGKFKHNKYPYFSVTISYVTIESRENFFNRSIFGIHFLPVLNVLYYVLYFCLFSDVDIAISSSRRTTSLQACLKIYIFNKIHDYLISTSTEPQKSKLGNTFYSQQRTGRFASEQKRCIKIHFEVSSLMKRYS